MPKVKEIFEEQLKKCQVDYFDFYLFHNVCEKNIDLYLDPKYGVREYITAQKKNGRIKHLGFSCHGGAKMIEEFLEYCHGEMEFCQIQLNYLDWTLQDAKEKVRVLNEHNIPIWVMEPVRGGKLASVDDKAKEMLRKVSPVDDPAALAFRFLQAVPGIAVILSGMSSQEQMEKNVKTFEKEAPLNDEQFDKMLEVAELFKDSVPCTACRYCCSGCPMQLDIPTLITMYNEIRIAPTFIARMRLDALPEEQQPKNCIGCGQCVSACPQGIDVPNVLADLIERNSKIQSWVDICREREAAAEALAAKK